VIQPNVPGVELEPSTELLVAILSRPTDAQGVLDLGIVATAAGDDPVLYAFSDEAAFRAHAGDAPFAVARAGGLFGFALRNGICRARIIGSDGERTLETEELERIASAGSLVTASAPPATYVEAARRWLDERGGRGYMLERPRVGGRRHLVLAVALDDPAEQAALRDALRDELGSGGGPKLSLMLLTAAQAEELDRAGVDRIG
jgi:hypothetical protein